LRRIYVVRLGREDGTFLLQNRNTIMSDDPSILRVECSRLQRALATRREQRRQAWSDRRMDDYDRLRGDCETIWLLLIEAEKRLAAAVQEVQPCP
jgi:hypothetical protein